MLKENENVKTNVLEELFECREEKTLKIYKKV